MQILSQQMTDQSADPAPLMFSRPGLHRPPKDTGQASAVSFTVAENGFELVKVCEGRQKGWCGRDA